MTPKGLSDRRRNGVAYDFDQEDKNYRHDGVSCRDSRQ